MPYPVGYLARLLMATLPGRYQLNTIEHQQNISRCSALSLFILVLFFTVHSSCLSSRACSFWSIFACRFLHTPFPSSPPAKLFHHTKGARVIILLIVVIVVIVITIIIVVINVAQRPLVVVFSFCFSFSFCFCFSSATASSLLLSPPHCFPCSIFSHRLETCYRMCAVANFLVFLVDGRSVPLSQRESEEKEK